MQVYHPPLELAVQGVCASIRDPLPFFANAIHRSRGRSHIVTSALSGTAGCVEQSGCWVLAGTCNIQISLCIALVHVRAWNKVLKAVASEAGTLP
eukprot:525872-Rhodomonas_salina.1